MVTNSSHLLYSCGGGTTTIIVAKGGAHACHRHNSTFGDPSAPSQGPAGNVHSGIASRRQ